MSDTISVIIPAYNVEEYIAKCLDSVLSQTYTDLEVIVINDGSTDSTAEIAKKYVTDPRLIVIDQKNAGVSAARNAGIAAASGKLLAFVDSDDYIEPQMYELLHAALRENNADMAICNYNLIYDSHTDKQYSRVCSETADIYDDVYGYFCKYCACPKPNNYMWTRLYYTDIVKKSGVLFENFRLGDDVLFSFKLLPHMKRVAFIEDGLYNYYQRSSSNVYTVAKKVNLAETYADTFDALADHFTMNSFDEFLPILPIHAFTRLRSVFFYSRLAGMSEEDIIQSIMTGFKNRKIAEYLTGAL